jgi:uncharacterized protein YuzE
MNSFSYDPSVDAGYFTLAKPISSTLCEEVGSGVIVEYDATQTVIGVELLGVTMLTPHDIEPLQPLVSKRNYADLLCAIELKQN